MNATHHEPDAGESIRAPRLHRIWAWIFPALAALAGLWLLFASWRQEGPEVAIRFAQAPGIQPGKTALIYRGVVAGRVTGVTLDPKLEGVTVRVRLLSFAAELASKNTEFWVDQPVISIRQTTGLDAIIQGNSIRARYGGGEPAYVFHGLEKPPLNPLAIPALSLRLYADDIPFLGRGTPVYHRGVTVGAVRDKQVDDKGRPYLEVAVDDRYKETVLTNSRFWILPATSLRLSARAATVDVAGLDALTEGGVAFDSFGPGGTPAADHSEFPLAASELRARMDGPEITLALEDARGLVAGETLVNCFGVPVAIINRITLDPAQRIVRARAQFDPHFAHLATSGAHFTLVRPRVTLDGVSGLDTLLSGPYIALEPGPGDRVGEFAVRAMTDDEWQRAQDEREGTTLVVTSREMPPLQVGAPVLYRGLPAGRVVEIFSGPGGRPSLRLAITKDFRTRVTERTRFWNVPAASVAAGPGVLEINVAGVTGFLRGALAFDDFSGLDTPAAPLGPGATLVLHASEASARAVSPAVRITLANGQGLLPGKTQMRRLGIPVGLVDTVETRGDRVVVTARFEAGHDDLRREGATFAIVQPKISLAGLTGIETLLSGVYIDCFPGRGREVAGFSASSTALPELMEDRENGFRLVLTTDRTIVSPGAPVTFRDLKVGEVVGKTLGPDGSEVRLIVSIEPKYRDLVRENTIFWDASGIDAQIGFIKVKIHSPAPLAAAGKISFFTPNSSGEPVSPGSSFRLATQPPRR